MNSGSYFVIIGGMICYGVLSFLIEKLCVVFSKKSFARKIGIFVHEDSFTGSFVDGTLKLFLECYFDLVICTGINSTAFIRSKNLEDFKEFFETTDDTICSTLVILHVCFLLFFPIYTYHLINTNQEKFEKKEGLLEVLMEGVDPHCWHASMYSFYFLLRRFLTGIGLVIFIDF